MAKKLKAPTKSDDKQLSKAVRNSAQQIWQAGLGAFAKAQDEGGKAFAKLVKDGTELQKRTQKLAEEKVSDVSGSVSKMAENVSKKAADSWDKLEQVFEDRVARSLASLGVPTEHDIQTLTKRVEELSKQVAALSPKKTSAPGKAASGTAVKAKKVAPRPAAIKKPVTKRAAPKVRPLKKSSTKPAAK